MKKILYTALAASLFAFSSCDDILDTSKKSSMEKTEVFSNEALVNDVVMGLHQSFGETNSYRGRYIAYFFISESSFLPRIIPDFTVAVDSEVGNITSTIRVCFTE